MKLMSKFKRKITLRKLRLYLLRLAFIPIVLIGIFVRPLWSLDSVTSFVIEFSGYLFLLAGLAIRIWCTFYIGSRKSQQIVDQGPYSICRNPLYIGTFFIAVGVGLCFENMLMVILVPAIIIPVHIIAARMEETHLESIFGEQYNLYRQNVPAFWPRFSNYKSPTMIEVNIHSLKRIIVDTMIILLLPQIEDLLELLHHYGIVPVLWYFPK